MLEPTIDPKDLETWAGYLLDHSLGGIAPGERVMVKGERIAWPLMAVLERRIVAAGGLPDVCVVPPNNERGRVWSAAMGRLGSESQLAAVPDWHRARYDAMDKYVEVLGAESPADYAGLSGAQAARLAAADAPFSRVRLSKPWVITLYPTPGFAALEGMALEDYAAFIVRASTTDPGPLRTAEERIAPLLDAARTLRVLTHHPREDRPLELRADVTAGIAQLSDGRHNFPDGEVFTSPDANATEGEIYVDLPVQYGGTTIRGVHLVFEGGRITRYAAETGAAELAAIIETDEGSHRLGEVAFGMNPGLDRVLTHPLFVEKVGGTLHIAIGASYEHCFVKDPGSAEGKAEVERLVAAGVLNRSARHVDIVTDFRPGGCGRRVFLDDRELVVRDGVWVPLG